MHFGEEPGVRGRQEGAKREAKESQEEAKRETRGSQKGGHRELIGSVGQASRWRHFELFDLHGHVDLFDLYGHLVLYFVWRLCNEAVQGTRCPRGARTVPARCPYGAR